MSSKETSGRAALTVGELRQALENLPADTPLLAYGPAAPGSDAVQDYIVVTAGFGSRDAGDGHGPHPSREFQIGVAYPDNAFYRADR
ncbi:DUF6225 family protein [Streptomyces sp. NPDC006147]|uniref:DUF6225 family protein n=1 Tax=Streptomyces sp. NPDC006147 TaxID=3155597 RepID=UPI0033A1D73E